MFSKACEYAIRALLFIAQKTCNGSKVGIREIAKGIDSPEHFIAKILQGLSRKGLVQSQKGPSGGFYLDESSLNATLADVVRAVDGDSIFSGCATGTKTMQRGQTLPAAQRVQKDPRRHLAYAAVSHAGRIQSATRKSKLFLKR
ncbi:RrF2 family transcriptional regulator [Puia sp. P3]|uniref:RrF2 family transcriptional regulator n=1 Tax=Puia sp. P3 TaxID=3423952 RepID=UPI003D678FF9